MSERKQQFTIEVKYFKNTGKFYTSGEFTTEFTDCGPDGHPTCYMNDVVCYLKDFPHRGEELPGLASRTWDGPVYVDCPEHGFPILIPRGIEG